MANWKEFRASVGRAANKAWIKTEEFADHASMQVKLKTLEAKRNAQYELLGKLTYRQIKSGESQAEQIAPVIEEIDTLREKARVLLAEIEAAKKAKEEKKAKEAQAKQQDAAENEEKTADEV